MAHVYVSNADSGDITVLRMDAAGVLSLQGQQRLGGNLMPMALHPTGKMLYVARRTDPMAWPSTRSAGICTRVPRPLCQRAWPM
jgi:6-phosphogluconolactonase